MPIPIDNSPSGKTLKRLITIFVPAEADQA